MGPIPLSFVEAGAVSIGAAERAAAVLLTGAALTMVDVARRMLAAMMNFMLIIDV